MFSDYKERFDSRASQIYFKSFYDGEILARLSFFKPQFLVKKYLILKKREPSPKGF